MQFAECVLDEVDVEFPVDANGVVLIKRTIVQQLPSGTGRYNLTGVEKDHHVVN